MRYTIIAIIVLTSVAACDKTVAEPGHADAGSKLVYTPPKPTPEAPKSDIVLPSPDGGTLTDPAGFDRVWDTGCLAKGDREWQAIFAKLKEQWGTSPEADGGTRQNFPEGGVQVDPKVMRHVITCLDSAPVGAPAWPSD